eukprot:6270381-Amphidinium_carterae.1
MARHSQASRCLHYERSPSVLGLVLAQRVFAVSCESKLGHQVQSGERETETCNWCVCRSNHVQDHQPLAFSGKALQVRHRFHAAKSHASIVVTI